MTKDLAGVEEDQALKKLLNSDDEDEENEDKKKEDADNKEDEEKPKKGEFISLLHGLGWCSDTFIWEVRDSSIVINIRLWLIGEYAKLNQTERFDLIMLLFNWNLTSWQNGGA